MPYFNFGKCLPISVPLCRYAILNECASLVKRGVMKAEDVEVVMKDGLGYRYAWLGPLETALLNADGDFCF